MINFRSILVFILLLCTCTGQLNAAKTHNKAFRNIWHPTFLGDRLDYCTVDGRECGKAVANRYCQMLGYDYASQNVIAYNVGLTNYLDTRARCTGWSCNGFMTIGCATSFTHVPPRPYHYREKRFADPRYNEYRVDWCYDLRHGCGSKAANSFCSRMGFIQAKHYFKETHIGATKAVGTQQLCFGNQCNAFKAIVCYR